jgi:CheY-like chemotaxis protein
MELNMAKMVFAEPPEDRDDDDGREPWLILVADDEGDVHMVTKLVLKDFRFEGRPVELISSYSGGETVELIRKYPRTAVLLLDVVMENYTAGLKVVNDVRTELLNHEVRIVLRSGQAGYANVSEIIRQYDINNFVRKEHLRHQDLKDAVLIALRSYRDIQQAKAKADKPSA